MVATFVTMSGPSPGLAQIARMAQEAIEGWLREYDGYLGLVILTNDDEQRARIVTFWDTPENEFRSRQGRHAMRSQIANAAELAIEEIEVYEVPVFELVDPAEEPPGTGAAG